MNCVFPVDVLRPSRCHPEPGVISTGTKWSGEIPLAIDHTHHEQPVQCACESTCVSLPEEERPLQGCVGAIHSLIFCNKFYKNLIYRFNFPLPFYFLCDRMAKLALVCRRAAASVEKRVFRREIKPRLFRRWQTAPSIAVRQCCRAPASPGADAEIRFAPAWLGCLAHSGTLFPH